MHCAASHISKAPHSGHLREPEATPGKLHLDVKGMLVESIEGYKYVLFGIDEYTRMVFVQFLKAKSEVAGAVKLMIAEFNATVGTPLDSDEAPKARPVVRETRSDHEGGLESHAFKEFRISSSLHSTMSPPHDHDLNPIRVHYASKAVH